MKAILLLSAWIIAMAINPTVTAHVAPPSDIAFILVICFIIDIAKYAGEKK